MPKKTRNRTADSRANLEPYPSDAPVAANELEAFASQVRITLYHTRSRLADLDGLSGKAIIDGIVAAGVLVSDSPKQVAEVTHSQSKGSPEETRIVIEEI